MQKNEQSYELINRLGLRSRIQISSHSIKAQIYCPFHNEKNPSMFIDMKNGIYHCFSCRRKGTINQLCKEITGKSIYTYLNLKYDEFTEFSKTYKKEVIDFDKIPIIKIKESNPEIRFEDIPNIREVNAFMRKRGFNKYILKKYFFRQS
jgi:DNA primase